ncbi:hypothetical protein GCM10009814_22610 [Lapillicoccus jejuensis]|uniref:NADH-quinone oxidoreductase subunit B n=1 Tax=Lapillicoccus jejuensis TaxID=402171 RepID=A0A542DXG8_9MICO|nr:NADH-quinone oxidoreductase B subunit [Lapillicoccus jejuensis]
MTTDLPLPTVRPALGPVAAHAPEPVKVVLNWGRRYSLWVFNFGLACCAIEFIAASMARHDFIRLGVIPFAPGPRQADLMVVSGTVTDKMAPAVRRLYDQMPEPKYVISFGACSNSGGPYWDSYSVTKGVDTIIPVDVYVPGCPPRPEALLQGIVKLQEKIAAERVGETLERRYASGRLATAAEVTRRLVKRPEKPGPQPLPGRGDALTPRPGAAAPPTTAPAGGTAPPTQAIPTEPDTRPLPVGPAEVPVAPSGPEASAAPPTRTLPAVADPAAYGVPPEQRPAPAARRTATPLRERTEPRRTLADDIFELAEDEERPDDGGDGPEGPR